MNETRELQLTGIDHRTAPASVRHAGLSTPQASALLRHTAAAVPGLEATILSTCHRTEFYVAAPPGSPALQMLLASARREAPNTSIRRSECERYDLSGVAAMKHLLRVACGLESVTLGDAQILSQIKQAVDVAAVSGTLGQTLSRAFTQAIGCGRKARAETTINRGCASIGSAIVETISRHLRRTNSPEVPRLLLVGAGDTAADIAWHLSKRHLGNWTIVNRAREDAYRLAARCGGEVARWEELDRLVASSNVVVTATSASQPLVRRDHLASIAAARPSRFPLFIDAGVPRNIDFAGQYPVVDVDAIRERREAVLNARQSAIPDVERLIEIELERWKHWVAARPIEASLADLYRGIEEHSQEVARKLFVNNAVRSPEYAQTVLRTSLRRFVTEHARRLRRLQSDAARMKEQAWAADSSLKS